ncbi:hypothetical protein JOM56_001860 [Amanita muscaria]
MPPRVFFIPELLRLICENCDQATLAALALTSRHFYEPAQAILWYDLDNLGPLIRCMPDDLWRGRKLSDSWTELSFCRSIKETDWDRFRANATRVRRFGFTGDFGHTNFLLATDVYHFFHQAGVTTSLLPEVQTLTWPCFGQGDTDDVFPHISLFLSPSVQELDIAVISSQPKRCQSRVSLLPSLVSLCPNIVSFHLNVTNDMVNQNYPAQQHYYLATYPIIERWQSLQRLCITGLPGATLSDLPRLAPTLKTLEISFWASNFQESLESLPSVWKFTAMDTLIVRNCRYDFALQLIQMMGQSPLRSLVLDLDEEYCHFSPGEWQSLFRTMQVHLVHYSLEELCLDSWYPHEEDDPLEPHPLTVGLLEPLFPFKNLRKLSIAYCDSFHLDDAAIEVVAAAWVHLEYLQFREYEHSPLPVCTIRGLISIAKHCRALRHLEFAFNAAFITEDDMKLMSGVRNESLRVLNVEHSPIRDHSLVAAALSKIVPMVRFIGIPQFGDGLWKEVETLLQILATS